MSIIGYLLSLVVVGLIVGALGRLALPGRDPMSIPQTIMIGIVGSLAAGLLVWAISGNRNGGGFILSVLCATGLVYLVRRSRSHHDRPAGPRTGAFGR